MASFVIPASIVCAQIPDDGPTIEGAQPITGRVIDESGHPISNATVAVRAVISRIPPQNFNTNRDGDFKTEPLEPGLYILSAHYPAYVLERREFEPTANPYYRPGDSVTLRLIRGGVITGTVTRANGEPMVGSSVRAYMVRDAGGRKLRFGVPPVAGSTDDRGSYRIYGLLAGTYVIAAGGPLPNRGQVTAFDLDQPTYFPSADRGTANEVVVHAGQEVTADILHQEKSGHSIGGTVTGLTSAPFGMSTANVTLTRMISGNPDWTVFAFQNNTGFEFTGLTDGNYILMGQLFGPGPQSQITEPLNVIVKGQDVTGLKLVPKALGSIKGQISLQRSSDETCKGKRLPNFAEMFVTARADERTTGELPPLRIGRTAQTNVDSSGMFHVRNLFADDYLLDVQLFANYWYVKSVQMRQADNLDRKKTGKLSSPRNVISLKNGEELDGVKVTLAEGAALLKGKVSQNPGLRSLVFLIPADVEAANSPFNYYGTQIQPDETFRFANIAPGRYWILRKEFREDDPFSIAGFRTASMREMRSKLRSEAERMNTSLVLKQCQNINDYELSDGPERVATRP